MNMQQIAANVLALMAVFYLAWRYSPRKYRLVAGRLINRMFSKPVAMGFAGEAAKSPHCGDGCGACSGCGLSGAGDIAKSADRAIKTFTLE